MQALSLFDEIRPYRDEEVPGAMAKLAENPTFTEVIQYVFPEMDDDQIRSKLAAIRSVDDFQHSIAHPTMRQLVNRTSESTAVEGLDLIRPDESYLFISNHRDIILDSALLNMFLLEAGFPTTQTAIGNNLLSSPLVTHLTRLNKNFVVKRNTGAREFYENSMLLSQYISHHISNRLSSIWIAQREGRTKDGLDKTQPGLLKMLSISCEKPVEQCFKDLRITPIAVSYEHDPCDVLKIPQLKAISRDEKYEKAPDEDFRSILTGLTGEKGRIKLEIGKTLDEELDELNAYSNVNDKLRVLGELIDQQIVQLYTLWPTNYMAYDLLEGRESSRAEHEGKSIRAFKAEAKTKLRKAGLDTEEDYRWLLKMYANPVKNKVLVKSPL